ncbi:cytochrome P450 [Desarmillaria ectypa]|nr:cytochrome P450 [Desarmillaria ectypa]
MTVTLLLVLLAFGVLLVNLLSRLSLRRGRLPLPPSPKGLPLIGNLWDVPTEYPWLTYARWIATYAYILYLDTLRNPTVVINSSQAVADLCEKCSGNYSDRPDYTMAKLSGWGSIMGFMRYSDQWRSAKGLAPLSFISENIAKVNQFGAPGSVPHLDITRDTAGVAFAAGADTTVSTILSVILAFLLYPEVQTKAQVELDAVVAPTRLPNFDDCLQLSYINAIVVDALRWNPVVPMGVDYRNVQKDAYRGYYFPAGATIVGNVWAMLYDEKYYPNPLVFYPNRNQ